MFRLTATTLAMLVCIAFTPTASAYIGPSFLYIPDAAGEWQGAHYKGWIHANAHYWSTEPIVQQGLNRERAAYFSGPLAPRQGPSSLMLAIDKKNPSLPQLMDRCASKTAIPEVAFAESSDTSRTIYEIGQRPAQVPDYYEYKLTNARINDCPIVADAPEQAIVISFESIALANYQLKDAAPVFEPVALSPKPPSRTTKSFLVTWIGVAHDVSPDQCPTVAQKPTEEDYYAFVPKAEADRLRAFLAPKGGVSYINGQMGLRGPNGLNVCKLPGIIRDPGNPTPQAKFARGLDLDANDGTGAPATDTCQHTNFVSADGRAGIDNQLFAVLGCVPALQGHRGWTQQFTNNQMRDGAFSMLLQITGLDDTRNDDNVDLTLLYSLDPMARSGDGKQVLSEYTFRVTNDPQYTHYFRRFHGRIVNGVLTTDQVKDLRLNLGKYGTPSERHFLDARLRLELTPDGNIKGVIGGYQDVWWIANQFAASAGEEQQGYQCPAIYNALKRAADGMRDPATGECNAISVAYDIEATPAFIAVPRTKVAQVESGR